jgi:5'-3' exoribonuclease 1
MFTIYKEILPTMGGYMNDCGTLNLQRCELFLKKMGEVELSNFKGTLGDLSWLTSKRKDELCTDQVEDVPLGNYCFLF